jgi:hypothetical protein
MSNQVQVLSAVPLHSDIFSSSRMSDRQSFTPYLCYVFAIAVGLVK